MKQNNQTRHISRTIDADVFTNHTGEILLAKKVGGNKGSDGNPRYSNRAYLMMGNKNPGKKVWYTVIRVQHSPKGRHIKATGFLTDRRAAVRFFNDLQGYNATTYYNNRKPYQSKDGKTRRGTGWVTTFAKAK